MLATIYRGEFAILKTKVRAYEVMLHSARLTCSFGTFYFKNGEWRWIVDPDFVLRVAEGSHSRLAEVAA